MQRFLTEVQAYSRSLREGHAAAADIGYWIGECRVRLKACEQQSPGALDGRSLLAQILRDVLSTLVAYRGHLYQFAAIGNAGELAAGIVGSLSLQTFAAAKASSTQDPRTSGRSRKA